MHFKLKGTKLKDLGFVMQEGPVADN